MAGIIAGRDSAARQGSEAEDTTDFLGMAPDARIISIKVADANGATDVSQMLAAIDWVVQHRDSDGLHIGVLNLSFGTDSNQSGENMIGWVRSARYLGSRTGMGLMFSIWPVDQWKRETSARPAP